MINIWLMTSRWCLHQECICSTHSDCFTQLLQLKTFIFLGQCQGPGIGAKTVCINKSKIFCVLIGSLLWLDMFSFADSFWRCVCLDWLFLIWVVGLSIKVALAQACNTISCRNCLEIQLPRTTFEYLPYLSEAFKSGDHHHHHYHYRHHHHRHVFVLLHQKLQWPLSGGTIF